MIMDQERIQELANNLKKCIGSDCNEEMIKGMMERVILYRPPRDADDIVAASVGLPTEAVTIIRKMVKELCGGETLQKSRLFYHSPELRFRPSFDCPGSKGVGEQIYTPSYRDHLNKRVNTK